MPKPTLLSVLLRENSLINSVFNKGIFSAGVWLRHLANMTLATTKAAKNWLAILLPYSMAVSCKSSPMNCTSKFRLHDIVCLPKDYRRIDPPAKQVEVQMNIFIMDILEISDQVGITREITHSIGETSFVKTLSLF